jgi:hypothetical protein
MKDVLWRLAGTGLARPREVAALGVALTGHVRGMEATEVRAAELGIRIRINIPCGVSR